VSVLISEQSWPQVREAIDGGAVLVVPVGATEQHGEHLPIETDSLLCATVARRACELSADLPALVTPPIWTGFSPHHMDFAGSVTLSLPTFLGVVTDVARSLWAHGARKILLLNGHGGNANLLRSAVQALRFEHGIRVATGSYWDFALRAIADWRESGPGGIDHACELETALMLAVRPDLVDMERVRDASWFPRSQFLSGDLAIGAPVSVAFSFAELSDDGVLGDPTTSSAERGEALLVAICARVAEFLREFAEWDWDKPREI
jgi:creatinine amidohydrolase